MALSLTNITLSGPQTIDGVSCVAGDRVLVGGQTDQTKNGIYLVQSGDWIRAPDFDDNADLLFGTIIHVTGGSSNSGLYALTTPNDITLDTDNITFASLLTLIGASSLLAANNLSDVASAIAAFDNIKAVGSDIAADSTVDLDAATGDFVTITGNTGISAVTLAAGSERWVRFTGTPTITVGSSLVGNNGGSNITAAAGDTAYLRGFASGVVRFVLFRADGSTVASVSNVTDSAFRIQGSSDATKKLAIEVDGFTSGQTRTMTPPDANFVPAALNLENQTVSGGALVTPKDLGSLSGETITPDPGDRPIQKITNNGAGSILPGSAVGQYTLLVVNASGAGAITTTGWTLKGDSFDTTSSSKFICSCIVTSDAKMMSITKYA